MCINVLPYKVDSDVFKRRIGSIIVLKIRLFKCYMYVFLLIVYIFRHSGSSLEQGSIRFNKVFCWSNFAYKYGIMFNINHLKSL